MLRSCYTMVEWVLRCDSFVAVDHAWEGVVQQHSGQQRDSIFDNSRGRTSNSTSLSTQECLGRQSNMHKERPCTGDHMDQAMADREERDPLCESPIRVTPSTKARFHFHLHMRRRPPAFAETLRAARTHASAYCATLVPCSSKEQATNQMHLQHPATPANLLRNQSDGWFNLCVTLATTPAANTNQGLASTRTRGAASLCAHRVWNFTSPFAWATGLGCARLDWVSAKRGSFGRSKRFFPDAVLLKRGIAITTMNVPRLGGVVACCTR